MNIEKKLMRLNMTQIDKHTDRQTSRNYQTCYLPALRLMENKCDIVI